MKKTMPAAGVAGLIKSLVPGLLPLLVFMVVSEIWGDMAGVWVGTAMGVVEFLVILVVQRRLDAFVLVDTGLLVGTGLVSVLLADDVFFRFKPVIMELILVAILGVSAFGPRDLLTGMALRGEAARRVRQGMADNPAARQAMQSMMRSLFWLLLGHALLGAAAALWMSVEAWGFITGVLPVLLLGIWFGVRLLLVRLQQRRQTRLLARREALAASGLAAARAAGHVASLAGGPRAGSPGRPDQGSPS